MTKFLDAKYNDLLDSAAFRVALIAGGFAMWFALGFGVLRLAA